MDFAPKAFVRAIAKRASSKLFTTALKSPSAPYKIKPVENILGPTKWPLFWSSSKVKAAAVCTDGSWAVVTPKAKFA